MPMSLGLGLGLTHVGGDPFAAYTANGYAPAVVLDWSQNKAKGVAFSDLVHTRAGNATQVASDGTVQWAPHNLLTYSDMTGAVVGVVGSGGSLPTNWTVDGSTVVEVISIGTYEIVLDLSWDNSGGGGLVYPGIRIPFSGADGVQYTAKLTGSVSDATDLLSDQISAQKTGVGNTSFGTFTVADGYHTFSESAEISGVASALQLYGTVAAGDNCSFRLTIKEAHLYRSDLGGMANNPARNDTYVPTTSAAVYLPRVENHIYSGGEWKKRGLIEPAATNLLTYSAQFDNAAWLKTAASITANDATGPDGETTGDKLVEDTAMGTHYVGQAYTLTSGSVVTLSVFVKADERSWVRLTVNSATGANASAYFNVSTGAVGTIGGGTAAIEAYGNAWYRCSVSGTLSTTNPTFLILLANGDDGQSYTGDGSSGVHIYGAQIENNLAVSSYIPTSGSTATRAADTYHIPPEVLAGAVTTQGAELVTNGGFDTDTDWTKGAGWTIGSGTLNSSAAMGTVASQNALTVGKRYLVTFEITAYTSGQVRLNCGWSGYGTYRSAVGTYSEIIEASGSGFIEATAHGSGFTGSIDNVSVTEITMPSAVSIAVRGEMSYGDEDLGEQAIFNRWEADTNNRIYSYLNTTSTQTGRTVFWQREGGNTADFVSTPNSAYSSGVNVPFSIASAHSDSRVNGAHEGTALTENTTVTALADLTTADFEIAPVGVINLERLLIWTEDVGDTGLEETSA